MELTGHEKPLEQYSKSELMQIARRYTVYHRDSVRGNPSADYTKLSKSELIKYIKSDTDYIVSKSNSRVEMLKQKIVGVTDPEEIMLEIINIFDDTEIIPDVGMFCTFIYNAKTVRNRSNERVVPSTNKVFYDQHPLIQVLGVYQWGFRGFNYHWRSAGEEIHNYTWNEVAGQLHVIRGYEMPYMRTVDYAELKRYSVI